MKRVIATLSLLGIAGIAALWHYSGNERRGAVEPPASEPEPERKAAAEDPPMLAPPEVQPAPQTPARTVVEEVAAPAQPERAPEPSAERPKAAAVVRGRCVDGAAQPLAEVAITGSGLGEGARSAADGSFELDVDLFGQLSRTSKLEFAREGLGTRHIQSLLRAGEATDLGDVVLVLQGRVSGRVVDGHGLGIGGAHVRVSEALDRNPGSRFDGPNAPIAAGESDAAGRFLLEGVPSGMIRVWAGQEEWSWSSTGGLELAPGGEIAGLELVITPLEREDTIRLLVLDPAGAPVPHAEIQYLYETAASSGSGSTQADEQGRFKQFLDVRTTYSFQASDPVNRYSPAVAYDVAPGVHDLVLQLGEKRSFRLRVEEEETGAPIVRFQVRTEQARGRFQSEHEPPEKGSAGEVEIVLPPATFELSVEADGFEVAKLGPFEPAQVPRELVARLKSLPGVRGRVTGPDGPIAGASVGLHRARSGSYSVNGFACFADPFAKTDTRTDENGEYVLTLRESGSWYVRAVAAGFAPGDLGPLELAPGAGAHGLDLVLGRGGTIEGRVLVPANEERSGLIVGLSRGDGHGFTARTDADGEYRFAGLTPGSWQVVRRKSEISTNSTSTSSSDDETPEEIPWDCVVYEGRTTRFDLDLRAGQAAALSGRLLLGGKAPIGWTVTFSPTHEIGAEGEAVSLDSDGRFRVSADEAGSFQLAFDGFANLVHASTTVELAPGENAWEADVPIGSLRGRIRPGLLESGARLQVFSEAYPGMGFWLEPVRETDGSFRADLLPAGPARVEYTPGSGEKVTREIDIPEGRAAEIDLP